jgi:DNA topoisomerase IA
MKPSRQQGLRKLLWFKDLEKEGIGRPSTYATIIGTIQESVVMCAKTVTLHWSLLITGLAVVQFLRRLISSDLVDYDFTSVKWNTGAG